MQDLTITDKNKQRALISIVAVSIFMYTLDYNMLNISMPSISHYFNVSVGTVALLPLAYLVILTSTLLGFGKLGDIRGYRNVFILGLGIFVVGSVMCGLSPNINVLIAARIFQSIGEAMYSPTGIALVTAFLPTQIKGRALGIMATAQGLGLSLGPVVGGFVNAHTSWRGIFFVNVPIAVMTILFALKMLPREQVRSTDKRFDYKGAISIFLALSTLLYGLNNAAKMGWMHPLILGCFVVFAVSFALFIFQEKKVRYPLLDLHLFQNKYFTFANLASFFAICVYIGVVFLMPFYLEFVREMEISKAGLILMLPSLIMMILSPLAGRFSDKIGSQKMCTIAMIPAILAFAGFSLMHETSSFVSIVVPLILLGLAMGLFMAPNNKLVMVHAPSDKQGIASGVYKTVINTGSVFGIALFPMVLAQSILWTISREHVDMAQVKHSPAIMQGGFESAFIFGAVLCVLALIFSLIAKDKRD